MEMQKNTRVSATVKPAAIITHMTMSNISPSHSFHALRRMMSSRASLQKSLSFSSFSFLSFLSSM